MMRHYGALAVLVTGLVGVAARPEQPELRGSVVGIYLPGKGSLKAVDGKIRIVRFGPEVDPKGPQARGLKQRDVSYLWWAGGAGPGTLQPKTEDRHNAWYLTADPRRKGEPLFLSEKPVPGSYWHLYVPDRGGPHSTGLQTRERLSLDVDETKGEKFLDGQRLCTGYPLKLVERAVRHFEIELISP